MVLTAKEWGWSPTAIIREAKNPHKHHWADYNFARAVKTLTDEKCPACGVPIWHAFSSDNTMEFKLKTISCYSCQHKDENGPKQEDKKAWENQVVYAVPVDGYDELPSRSAYFEREAKAHMAEHQREMERRTKFKAEYGIE
jgi:hypothetical protein